MRTPGSLKRVTVKTQRYIPQDTGKSYATEENAVKAAEDKFGGDTRDGLTYIIMPVEVKGKTRYVPVFIGERALKYGVQFHFHVLG